MLHLVFLGHRGLWGRMPWARWGKVLCLGQQQLGLSEQSDNDHELGCWDRDMVPCPPHDLRKEKQKLDTTNIRYHRRVIRLLRFCWRRPASPRHAGHCHWYWWNGSPIRAGCVPWEEKKICGLIWWVSEAEWTTGVLRNPWMIIDLVTRWRRSWTLFVDPKIHKMAFLSFGGRKLMGYWVREGFKNPNHGFLPWWGGRVPPFAVIFFR